MGCLARRLHRPRKSVGKYLALAGRMTTRQSLEHDVVTGLRIGCPIPRPVEGDEDTFAIASRKLLLVVQRHSIRRPMCGKRCNRRDLARADTQLLAPVAAILGSEHQFSL